MDTLKLSLILVFVWFTTSTFAHDRWANGDLVPEWVSKACCGPNDVHHLRPEQVHLRSDGYHIDGVDEIIPATKALPSVDGDYWVFYGTYSDGTQTKVYCFFSPLQGT